MTTNISPSPQQTLLSRLIQEVYLEIKGSLVMAMYQLEMLEFLEDIDMYMLELSRQHSLDSSPSFVTVLSIQTTSSPDISASSSHRCPLRRHPIPTLLTPSLIALVTIIVYLSLPRMILISLLMMLALTLSIAMDGAT